MLTDADATDATSMENVIHMVEVNVTLEGTPQSSFKVGQVFAPVTPFTPGWIAYLSIFGLLYGLVLLASLVILLRGTSCCGKGRRTKRRVAPYDDAGSKGALLHPDDPSATQLGYHPSGWMHATTPSEPYTPYMPTLATPMPVPSYFGGGVGRENVISPAYLTTSTTPNSLAALTLPGPDALFSPVPPHLSHLPPPESHLPVPRATTAMPAPAMPCYPNLAGHVAVTAETPSSTSSTASAEDALFRKLMEQFQPAGGAPFVHRPPKSVSPGPSAKTNDGGPAKGPFTDVKRLFLWCVILQACIRLVTFGALALARHWLVRRDAAATAAVSGSDQEAWCMIALDILFVLQGLPVIFHIITLTVLAYGWTLVYDYCQMDFGRQRQRKRAGSIFLALFLLSMTLSLGAFMYRNHTAELSCDMAASSSDAVCQVQLAALPADVRHDGWPCRLRRAHLLPLEQYSARLLSLHVLALLVCFAYYGYKLTRDCSIGAARVPMPLEERPHQLLAYSSAILVAVLSVRCLLLFVCPMALQALDAGTMTYLFWCEIVPLFWLLSILSSFQ